MAKLLSTTIYGNLDITGNLSINGNFICNSNSSDFETRVAGLEAAGPTISNNLIEVEKSLNRIQNNFNDLQGPIELQTTKTHIQWRKAGETEWKNLLTLESITPSVDIFDIKLNNYKAELNTQVSNLEKNVIDTLNQGISVSEIDTIISNALK